MLPELHRAQVALETLIEGCGSGSALLQIVLLLVGDETGKMLLLVSCAHGVVFDPQSSGQGAQMSLLQSDSAKG